MDWSAWRLLLSPARPTFASLGLAGVGGLDAGLPVDGVVGADDATSFFGGDGAAVGVAQDANYPRFCSYSVARARGGWLAVSEAALKVASYSTGGT